MYTESVGNDAKTQFQCIFTKFLYIFLFFYFHFSANISYICLLCAKADTQSLNSICCCCCSFRSLVYLLRLLNFQCVCYMLLTNEFCCVYLSVSTSTVHRLPRKQTATTISSIDSPKTIPFFVLNSKYLVNMEQTNLHSKLKPNL